MIMMLWPCCLRPAAVRGLDRGAGLGFSCCVSQVEFYRSSTNSYRAPSVPTCKPT